MSYRGLYKFLKIIIYMATEEVKEKIEKKFRYLEENHLNIGAKMRACTEIRKLINYDLEDGEERMRYRIRLETIAMQTC